MKKTLLVVRLLLLIILILSVSSLSAHCLDPYEVDLADGGNVSVSVDASRAELESTDDYLSGPGGTEDWRAVHDLDGDLYGISVKARPPVLGKRLKFDFSYMTGELDGRFSTREISPTPEGPYAGNVEFDRDQWHIGADVFILNALYTRFEYSTYKMEGDWVYDGGFPSEPQKYEFEAYTIGVGFIQNLGLTKSLWSKEKNAVYEGGIGLIIDLFAGYTFWEYTHTEQDTSTSVETDDSGYKLRADLLATYELDVKSVAQLFAYAGVGYRYEESDGGSVDLTDQGITAKFGLHGEF